jgi:hypothetical protein
VGPKKREKTKLKKRRTKEGKRHKNTLINFFFKKKKILKELSRFYAEEIYKLRQRQHKGTWRGWSLLRC